MCMLSLQCASKSFRGARASLIFFNQGQAILKNIISKYFEGVGEGGRQRITCLGQTNSQTSRKGYDMT